MADKQVRIDLVAEDDASRTIDKVADEVAHLEQLDPTVTVDAETKPAQRSVDDLLETVRHLDDQDATIVLGLRAASVQRDLVETLQLVETLDASDPQVQVQLDHAADVRADLDKLETAITDLNRTTVAPKVDASDVSHFADETGRAKDTMHGFVGGALGELPGVGTTFGPLTEAVGQMTEGLLAGEVAMGGLIAAAGPIAGVTIAVKLITDAINRQKKAAEEAQKRTEDWVKALKDAKGIRLDAIVDRLQDLIGTNQDFADSVADLNDVFGFAAQDIADALDGDISPALKRTQQFAEDYKKAQDKIGDLPSGTDEAEQILRNLADAYGLTLEQVKLLGPEVKTFTKTMKDQGVALDAAETDTKNQKDALKGLKTAAEETKPKVDNLTTAVDKSATAADAAKTAFDKMRGALNMQQDIDELVAKLGGAALTIGSHATVARDDIIGMKLAIIDVGETAKRTPVEVQTTLERLDRGEFDKVVSDVTRWSKQDPAVVNWRLASTPSNLQNALTNNGRGWGPSSQSATGQAAPTLVINQMFPRGFRTSSAIDEARRAAGRAGTLYMRGHLAR